MKPVKTIYSAVSSIEMISNIDSVHPLNFINMFLTVFQLMLYEVRHMPLLLAF
jgi:hypothetical protein